MGWSASSPFATADHGDAAIFEAAAIHERLRQPPPTSESAIGPPSRWTLRTVRAAIPDLATYTLSGVWRVLRRLGFARRTTQTQQFSPDPDYGAKRTRVLEVLAETGRSDGRVVTLFLDQMGFTRWPEPGSEWTERAPAPAPSTTRAGSTQQQWRLVGALDAVTGQVHALDNYIVGRRQMIAFYRQLDQAYPHAERLYVVQDNWSIHRHPDVIAAVEALPRVIPVFLPTYAPWLNPIEKLWRWLRQALLRNHAFAGDWSALRQRVRDVLTGMATIPDHLLRYVGLHGDGALAQALRGR